MSDMGVALAMLRKRAGLTQEALAEAAGCDRSYVAMIETGRRSPSWRFLLRVAESLKMSAVDLFQALGMVPPPDVDEAEMATLVDAYPELATVFTLAREHPTILPDLVRYAKYLVSELGDEQGEITSATDWATRG